jgi:hypothetical protein
MSSTDSGFHERRHTPRTPLYGGSFAVLHVENEAADTEILAQILDINKEGIAVRFFASSSRVPQVKKIDITLPNQNFSVEGLPVKIVDETTDRTNRGHGTTNAKVRRLSMRFDAMTPHKAQALDTLIEHFACGRAD